MAVTITTGTGVNGVLASGSQDGMIYFAGAIVGAGFHVQPALPTASTDLQAHPSASGDQVVLDFHPTAVRAVSIDVSVEARGASSLRSLRVGDARSKADVPTKYGGFKTSLLTANSGTLALSRAPGVEPALAVVTLSYQ